MSRLQHGFSKCIHRQLKPQRQPLEKGRTMKRTYLQQASPAQKLSLSGVLIALGVVLSAFYIPLGGAKLFPIQHLINVISAVLLGPWYALANASLISLIRNMTGMGSLLAFPGSMIGAFMAGMAYSRFGSHRFAALAEVIGTGIIGGTIAAPFAMMFMGLDVSLFYFLVPFVLSAFSGAAIAFVLLESTALITLIRRRQQQV